MFTISYIRNIIFTFCKCFRGKPTTCTLLYIITCVVITNEWVIWQFYKFRWPTLQCGDLEHYYKILIVADPQILGENSESWIARWDSDRFLRQTYFAAIQYTQPDVVVFLGDLMDEGSIATSDEFSRYLERFRWIFEHEKIHVNLTMYLPGDNDIGGEDDEPISRISLKRFEKYFGLKTDMENYENIEFYKVNKLLRRYPKVDHSNKTSIRIALSHIPVMGYPDETSEKAVKEMSPVMIFSAHDHKAFHIAGDLKTGESSYFEALTDNSKFFDQTTWRFQSTPSLTNEIVVPTCSYRMGVNKLGYGVAMIDKKGSYTCFFILWLPQRLYTLIFYLGFFILVLLIFIFCGLCQFKGKR